MLLKSVTILLYCKNEMIALYCDFELKVLEIYVSLWMFIELFIPIAQNERKS